MCVVSIICVLSVFDISYRFSRWERILRGFYIISLPSAQIKRFHTTFL